MFGNKKKGFFYDRICCSKSNFTPREAASFLEGNIFDVKDVAYTLAEKQDKRRYRYVNQSEHTHDKK